MRTRSWRNSSTEMQKHIWVFKNLLRNEPRVRRRPSGMEYGNPEKIFKEFPYENAEIAGRLNCH